MDAAAQHRWMEQWRAAAPALEDQRQREIQALTAERALAATEALLDLASPADLCAERRSYSGLVEMQRLLHLRPRQ